MIDSKVEIRVSAEGNGACVDSFTRRSGDSRMSQSNATTAPSLPLAPTGYGDVDQTRRIQPLARLAAWRQRLFGYSARKTTLALGDQAIVSGTSFLTTVLIGRACGPEELGGYSLGFSLWMLAQSMLHALVLIPYTVHVNRQPGRLHAVYAGASLVQAGGLAVVALLGMSAWATTLNSGFVPLESSVVVWGVAAVIPLMMLRDVARRFAFARLHALQACFLDLTVAIVQIGGIAALVAHDLLSANRVFLMIGLGCGIAGGAWLWLQKDSFRITRRSWPAALHRNWRFGRWVFAGQMVSQLNSEILMVWLLVFLLGKASAGVFAACMSIVLISNPFLLGIGNVLTPRITRAFYEGGPRQLRRAVARATLLIGGTMTLFCVAVVLLGGVAIVGLYGPEYRGNEAVICVLAISVSIGSLGMAVGSGLWALDRADVNFKVNCAGLAVTSISAAVLIPLLGLLGTALAMALGWSVRLCLRCRCFLLLSRSLPSPS